LAVGPQAGHAGAMWYAHYVRARAGQLPRILYGKQVRFEGDKGGSANRSGPY